MASFADGVIERYERYTWSHTLVARLNELACTAGVALAADALARERFNEARTFAARVRDIDHLNEQSCEIQIRALRACGAADAARREFSRYAAALRREFGASPSAALAGLLSTGP
jgi:two-component SAPR family response regulator